MSQKNKILQSVKSRLLSETKLTGTQIDSIVDKVAEDNPNTPWWVVVLKVIAYAIGIILAGYGTASAATFYLPTMLG